MSGAGRGGSPSGAVPGAVTVVVNGIQDVHTVYEALPPWGWWVGHAAFGSTLGLALAGRRGA